MRDYNTLGKFARQAFAFFAIAFGPVGIALADELPGEGNVVVAPYILSAKIELPEQSSVAHVGPSWLMSGTNVDVLLTFKCELQPGVPMPPGGAGEHWDPNGVASLILTCGNFPLAPSPADDPISNILLIGFEVKIGTQVINVPDRADSLFPFSAAEKTKYVTYRFRMASTFFYDGNLAPFNVSARFTVQYASGAHFEPQPVLTSNLPVKVYNKALVLATKESEPFPGSNLMRYDPSIEPGQVPQIAAASAAVARRIIVENPLNHVLVADKASEEWLKLDLVGSHGNNGSLLKPTFMCAITHGLTDQSGSYGFRPSYEYPEQDMYVGAISTRLRQNGGREAYDAVYGSASAPRRPAMNMVLMFSCNSLDLGSYYDAALAFGILADQDHILSDRAYVGFRAELKPVNVKPLEEWVEQFLLRLKAGSTVSQAVDSMSRLPGFTKVVPGIRGDPLARLAYVYLTGAEIASLRKAGKYDDWVNSWYWPSWGIP